MLDPSGTGAPAVGANVVFIDPGGTLVKRVATDSAGKADADVLPGASVTSVARINNVYQLQTVLAVKPGDDLVLGVKSSDFTSLGTFTVNYPAFASAANYEVAGPCGVLFISPPVAGGTPPTTATFTMSASCKVDPMELIVAPTDANFVPIAAIGKTGVPFVAGGSTTVTGSYQGVRSFTASYMNINPIVTSMSLSRTVPDTFGISSSLSVASPIPNQAINLTGGVSGSNARLISRFTTATRSFQDVRQNLSGTAATYGLDATANLLPWIDQPTIDLANRKLIIPLDTTGTSNAKPDLFRVSASYRRTDMNNVTTTFTWTIFAPEPGDIPLPALPPEAGDVLPTTTDTVGTVSAIMVEIDTVANYDAIRKDLNAAVTLYSGARPPATTVRSSSSPLQLR
ncbi:MAG: hypothetical protein E6J90_07980 [Deltaproteobacteria bacterium]|nr:MAG: hypothetical protein E6J91_44865 [Deltaproteobacteria bacterium]TMQ24469.1 MAG: hypothetical protein E6J90_07980 [Deltaproteobacteria bacterium]